MTEPLPATSLADVRAAPVGPGQKRALACEIARRHHADPDALGAEEARELLAMLGLTVNGAKTW